MDHASPALGDLLALGGLDPGLADTLELTGPEEFLPSVFRVGAAAVATTGAATLAVREILGLDGRARRAAVDGRHASMAFRSERHLRIDGGPPPSAWGPLSGYYRTTDGWIQVHCNFEHHAAGVIAELDSGSERDDVKAAIEKRGRFELEDALAARGMCATAFRSPDEWARHPQAKAVAELPVIEIVQIGDAPVEPLPARPDAGALGLTGVRTVDMTRIIAGPVCGRFLAAHGSTVMRVGAAHLPAIDALLGDSCMGKLATDIDLRTTAGRAAFDELARSADVVLQGYRPGGLAELGVGPEQLAQLRPGIVYASLSAYGHVGPWAPRRGFDSLVQTASGIGWAGMEAAGTEGPQPLPAQALDHASGYLLAFGVAVALHRRATIGGSWLVRGSLAQTGRWITGLGRHDGLGIDDPGPQPDLMVSSLGALGHLEVIAPVGTIEGASPRWERSAPLLGSSPPVWP